MTDVIRYTATVMVSALSDGVNEAKLPQPVRYYLAGEPGTDGTEGHWTPRQQFAGEFLDEQRIRNAIGVACDKARSSVVFSSVVTIHKKIIHTEVIWDPPLSSPTSLW